MRVLMYDVKVARADITKQAQGQGPTRGRAAPRGPGRDVSSGPRSFDIEPRSRACQDQDGTDTARYERRSKSTDVAWCGPGRN